MMITGAVITGVAYAVYKMVKSRKSNSQMVNTNYYGNSDYDDYKYDEFDYDCDCRDTKQDYEYEELKKSKRI